MNVDMKQTFSIPEWSVDFFQRHEDINLTCDQKVAVHYFEEDIEDLYGHGEWVILPGSIDVCLANDVDGLPGRIYYATYMVTNEN